MADEFDSRRGSDRTPSPSSSSPLQAREGRVGIDDPLAGHSPNTRGTEYHQWRDWWRTEENKSQRRALAHCSRNRWGGEIIPTSMRKKGEEICSLTCCCCCWVVETQDLHYLDGWSSRAASPADVPPCIQRPRDKYVTRFVFQSQEPATGCFHSQDLDIGAF